MKTKRAFNVAMFIRKFRGNTLICPNCKNDYENDLDKLCLGLHRKCRACKCVGKGYNRTALTDELSAMLNKS